MEGLQAVDSITKEAILICEHQVELMEALQFLEHVEYKGQSMSPYTTPSHCFII